MGMDQASFAITTAQERLNLGKGEEISYLQFGGSDILLVFEAKSVIVMTAQAETH